MTSVVHRSGYLLYLGVMHYERNDVSVFISVINCLCDMRKSLLCTLVALKFISGYAFGIRVSVQCIKTMWRYPVVKSTPVQHVL